MRNRCCKILGIIVLTLLHATEAWAQGPANPVRPAEPSPPGSLLLLLPFVVFLVIMLILMRRSRGLQPKMNRSLELAEEHVRLAREQAALQAETNRLLARLIEAQARD